jgi:leucyl/phenylalanyl-tRNA--protein transferase
LQNDEIVGGLYGMIWVICFVVKACFSKFRMPKLLFIALVATFAKENYKLLDCQVYEHLESLGCREIAREGFYVDSENK